jgi:hypothetical protein
MKTGLIVVLALSSFSVFASGLGGIKIDPKIPQELARKLDEDLTKLNQIKGGEVSPLHQLFFKSSKLDGRKYLKNFRNRVKSLTYKDVWYGNQIASASSDKSKRISITPNFLKNSDRLSTVATWIVLMHEAHHNDSKDTHEHISCPKPFTDENGDEVLSIFTDMKLAGTKSCDNKIDGSYSLNIVMLGNIYNQCDDCDADIKLKIEEYIEHFLKRIIDREVKKILIQDINWKSKGKRI